MAKRGPVSSPYIACSTASVNCFVEAFLPHRRSGSCPPCRLARWRPGAAWPRPFPEVLEHQDRRLHQRGRVRDALAGDVRRAAVDGFEDGVVLARCWRRARCPARPPGPPPGPRRCRRRGSASAARRTVSGRMTSCMRGVVDDQLLVLDLGIFARHLAAAAQEQAVAELHDVGLVDRGHLLAARSAARRRRRSGRCARRPCA